MVWLIFVATIRTRYAFMAAHALNASAYAFQAIVTVVALFIRYNRHAATGAAMSSGITLGQPFRRHGFRTMEKG